MTKLPDISEYFTTERALKEEVNWILDHTHGRHFEFLLPRLDEYKIQSVVEFGSGAGIVASSIIKKVPQYIGMDANDHFLATAKKRNPTLQFVKGDVRTWLPPWPADLALSSAFFKHFSLEEWDEIIARVLRAGKFGCFDVQLCANEHDDGTDYHHVFVSETHLERAVISAGHVIVEKKPMNGRTLANGDAASDMILWTRRRE
jgi:trans-aconitate methyltransferase